MRSTDAAVEEELARLLAGELDPKQFPHREHLRLAYEMLARHPFAETVSLFSTALRKLAAKGGRPELYHDTITVAFLARDRGAPGQREPRQLRFLYCGQPGLARQALPGALVR
jgi:hypothetical protein